jgi:hypothetical protein
MNREAHLPAGMITAAVGFGAGLSAAMMYLLLGGEYFWNAPAAASLFFSPGFAAGYQAYEWGLPEGASKIVGVLAVGLAYGALALLVRIAAVPACAVILALTRVLRSANRGGRPPESSNVK